MRAAQACALVYSFQGEALTGDEAELPRLAVLADLTAREVYRHVGELMRRDLVQRRGVWRAVLPHAIANRLAARALEDTPADLVEQQLVTEGTDRLARSFSRRLSYLHDSPHAVSIVDRWLAPGGLLGDVATLTHLGRAMLENVAPVSPEAALAALERVGEGDPAVAVETWHRHRSLLRSLAYDPPLFERSVALLARAATESADERTGGASLGHRRVSVHALSVGDARERRAASRRRRAAAPVGGGEGPGARGCGSGQDARSDALQLAP